jgi:hypothetical protein
MTALVLPMLPMLTLLVLLVLQLLAAVHPQVLIWWMTAGLESLLRGPVDQIRRTYRISVLRLHLRLPNSSTSSTSSSISIPLAYPFILSCAFAFGWVY